MEKQVPKCPKCWSPISNKGGSFGEFPSYECPQHGHFSVTEIVFGIPPAQIGVDLGSSEGDKTIIQHIQVHTSSCVQGSQRNPHLNKVLEKIAQLHDKKNHDYCPDDNNPFFNFEFSGAYSNSSPLDAFAVLLGTKLARLYALSVRKRGHEKVPNFESITDSEWDFVVYFLLREAYKLKLKEKERLDQASKDYEQ